MQQWTTKQAILTGGAIGGTLDILFAISFAVYSGGTAQQLLQTVASGLLGKAAYDGGPSTAALGFILHFLMAFLLAALFVYATRRSQFVTRNPVFAGAVFGIIVFFVMRLVVLPLSAFPHPVTFRPFAWSLDLLSHMFLFGVPIAWAAKKAAVLAGEPPTVP
jgi:uncharacterized membrane protein YagU involved in acid resistance